MRPWPTPSDCHSWVRLGRLIETMLQGRGTAHQGGDECGLSCGDDPNIILFLL